MDGRTVMVGQYRALDAAHDDARNKQLITYVTERQDMQLRLDMRLSV